MTKNREDKQLAYYPDFKHLMTTPQYGFLRTEPRLGRRIMLLGLGGSYAYGTNNEKIGRAHV